jgi:prevent-host-death family protein
MSKELGIFEAKNRLSELVDQAEKGERVYITRRGKRVAMLTAVEQGVRLDASSLFKAFRAFRSRAKRGAESLKDLIEAGRR